MLTPTQSDGLDIPEFLRVRPEDADERKRRNAEYARLHPPPQVVEQDARTARIEAERAAKKAAKTEALNALNRRTKAKKAAEAHGQYTERLPGTRWEPAVGKFVPINQPLSRAKFERCLSEMPTQRHREVFVKMYGDGRCQDTASEATDKSAADTAASPTGTKRTRKKRSDASASVAATSAPSKPAAAPKVAKALKPAAAPTGDAPKTRVPKEEQVAHVKGMLARPEGTTLAEAGARFGWQEHSTSAFISVNFRNKGIATTKEKVEGRGTVYRLAKG